MLASLLVLRNTRGLLVFRCLLHYWFKKGLPVKELFLTNHTLFSEKVRLRLVYYPILKQTQKYWLMTKNRYSALHGSDFKLPRFKKHPHCRFVLSLFSLCIHVTA